MKAKEFDILIRSKFDNGDFEYNPANWEQLTRQLEGKGGNNNKKLWLTIGLGIAASFTLFAAVNFIRQISAPVKNEVVVNTNTSKPIPSSPANQKEGTRQPMNTNNKIVASKTVVYKSKIAPAPTQSHINKEIAITNKNKNNDDKPIVDVAQNIKKKELPPFNTSSFYQYNKEETEERQKKLNISVGGGYNYGSMGSGYAVSATAHKNIGNNFYVEGDLALVNNSAISTLMPMQKDNFTSASPGTHSINSSEDGDKKSSKTTQKSLNLVYLQVSPVVGYSLHKKVSLGVGADFQKLMEERKQATELSFANGEVQSIPALDMGLIGKVEYALNKRIKAGISYREGFNNLIRAENDKYLERDYIQFQLKYSITRSR